MSTCISYHVYLNIILHLASQWLGKTLGIHQFVYQNANLHCRENQGFGKTSGITSYHVYQNAVHVASQGFGETGNIYYNVYCRTQLHLAS